MAGSGAYLPHYAGSRPRLGTRTTTANRHDGTGWHRATVSTVAGLPCAGGRWLPAGPPPPPPAGWEWLRDLWLATTTATATEGNQA